MAGPTIDIKGKSGKTYTFRICDFNSEWNSVPVVYIATRRLKSGNLHALLYIGQTDDLKKGFSNHHQQSRFTLNNADGLCTLIEETEEKRLAIESDLPAKYSTRWNH